MLSDAQKTKLVAAIAPLYADPDFAGVTDILAEVTLTPAPVPPAPETDSLDVPPQAELPAAPTNS
jgi:hypothetical protein